MHEPGGLHRRGVKIHEDVQVVESHHGSKRVTARVRKGRIEDVALAGDGLAAPQQLEQLAAALRGIELAPEPVRRVVAACHNGGAACSAAVIAEWVDAILELRKQPQGN